MLLFMSLTEVPLFSLFLFLWLGTHFRAAGTLGSDKQQFMLCGALEVFCLCSLGGTERLALVF